MWQQNEKQIVRATVECITKFGYHNFSMQDVAKTAGVSKGIIHYYFLNKDDLMMSVLGKVAGDIEEVLQSGMHDSDSPEKRLTVFMDVVFDVVRRTEGILSGQYGFLDPDQSKRRGEKVIASHYNKFEDTAKKVIEEGYHHR